MKKLLTLALLFYCVNSGLLKGGEAEEEESRDEVREMSVAEGRRRMYARADSSARSFTDPDHASVSGIVVPGKGVAIVGLVRPNKETVDGDGFDWREDYKASALVGVEEESSGASSGAEETEGASGGEGGIDRASLTCMTAEEATIAKAALAQIGGGEWGSVRRRKRKTSEPLPDDTVVSVQPTSTYSGLRVFHEEQSLSEKVEGGCKCCFWTMLNGVMLAAGYTIYQVTNPEFCPSPGYCVRPT